MENYGLALKKLREHFHITQRELGERVGISNHAISKWENGINQPDISALRALCLVYGITTEDFFRIAAGEDMESVLISQNVPSAEKMDGAGTSLTQNEPHSTGAGTSSFKEFLSTHKWFWGVISGVLALAVTLSVTLACIFNLEIDRPTNGGPSSSVTDSSGINGGSNDHSSDNSSSGGASTDDSSDSSDTGDGSEDLPPVTVLGHIDFYVDGEIWCMWDIMSDEVIKAPTPQKEGFVFQGWYTEEVGGEYFNFNTYDFENMDKSYDLYAQFRPIRYYVVFQNGYSSANTTFAVDYQEYWTFPDKIFSRPGYQLTGWQTEDGVIYSPGAAGVDLTFKDGILIRLTAVWEWEDPQAILVKFINPDGESAVAEQPQYVGVPFTLPHPTVTKVGYKFGGYYYKNQRYEAGDSFTISADEVSDGEFVIGWFWESIRFTIHYEMTYESQRYIVTEEYNYSSWDVFGYKEIFNSYIPNFNKVIGWVIDGVTYKPAAKIPDSFQVDGAVYYAEAILDLSINYTLKFVSNQSGTTGTMANIKANSNSPATLPECDFSVANYIFVGWEFNGKIYQPNEIFPYAEGITEYTLTAVWEGTPHVLHITSEKHPTHSFKVHVEYGYKFSFADLLSLCEEHGWDLTGLTLKRIKINDNSFSVEGIDYFSCVYGKEGEIVEIELRWAVDEQ